MLLALLGTGCTGGDGAETADPCVGVPNVTWSSFGKGFFTTYCTSCHSATAPDRRDAPEGIDFDTLDEVRTYQGAIRLAVLDEGTMPIGGGATEEDLLLLDDFLSCGL
jgi:uncharacterized membrane protein